MLLSKAFFQNFVSDEFLSRLMMGFVLFDGFLLGLMGFDGFLMGE